MWLATQHGWFSIVHKQGAYNVRARVKHDLQNILDAMPWADTVQIVEFPHADYRWRILLDEDQFRELWLWIGDIDYTNFKSHIATLPDQRAKLSAYHRIWAEMMDLQR